MPSHEPSAPVLDRPEQVVTALGLVAASRVTAFDLLAEDAVHAPRGQLRLALTRLAAGQVAGLDDLAGSIGEHDGGLAAAMAPYLEILDGIGERTRSVDWWERVVRSVVVGGMVRELARLVAGRLTEPARGVAGAVLAGQGLTGLVAAEVSLATGDDASLAARLALWGRRVAGEALGVVQPVLRTVESAGGTDLAALAAPALSTISASHTRRMERLGLAA